MNKKQRYHKVFANSTFTSSANIETQDTSDENEQRKKVIIAVSVAAVAIVVLCSLILCLFHTGILSTRLVKVVCHFTDHTYSHLAC